MPEVKTAKHEYKLQSHRDTPAEAQEPHVP